MSELIRKNTGRHAARWQLLAGVSALALAGSIASPALAHGDNEPDVWIELGGQLSRLQNSQDVFSPPVTGDRPGIFDPSEKFEKTPTYGFDGRAAISLRPDGSHWVFDASVQYGRARAEKHVVQNTVPARFPFAIVVGGYISPHAARFAQTDSDIMDQHTLVDFKVGRDVGLGLFGDRGQSVISAGVRYAQFSGNTNISLKSDPDWHFRYKYVAFFHKSIPTGEAFHSYRADLTAQRNFRGVGPSVSWNASAPLAEGEDSSLAFDWSLNGALLFGRQKVKVRHQSSIFYHPPSQNGLGKMAANFVTALPGGRTQTRSVTVPNIGGSAGLSFRYTDAKISFGYRADMFFGAMDGGLDARKSYDRAFFGPYASVSIGLGG